MCVLCGGIWVGGCDVYDCVSECFVGELYAYMFVCVCVCVCVCFSVYIHKWMHANVHFKPVQ